MADGDDTRSIVERYFAGWTSGHVEDSFSLLAEDLHFAGPIGQYESAADFLPALERFAAMTSSAEIVHLLVEGDRAAMLYRCELPEPVGTVSVASFFVVTGGRISWHETQFDVTELRKLLAAQGHE